MIVNLSDILDQAAERFGSRPSIRLGDATCSYAQLRDAAATVAAACDDSGLVRGDRVCVVADKTFGSLAMIFAAAQCGFVFVPLNPAAPPAMVAHILRDSGARALVGRTMALRRLAAAGGIAAGIPRPFPPHEPLLFAGDWQMVLGAPVASPRPSRSRPNGADAAALLYTSGSTGLAKGVIVSHSNFVAGAQSVNAYLEHTEADCLLAALPLSFDAGLSVVTTAMLAGARLVLHNYLQAEDCLQTMRAAAVTGLTAVPPLYTQLVAARAVDVPSLRYFANTGGAMPRPLLDRLRERFSSAAPVLMYGLTEAFRSTYLPPAEIDRRPDSIGKSIPGAEVMVLRPDGTPCDAGELGEIVHRGPTVALGYWNDPARTAERFRARTAMPEVPLSETVVWSGDFAYRDDEGFLYYAGRRDEQFKVSGYRVSPTEVEQAILAVGLVRETCVFGVVAADKVQITAFVYPPVDTQVLLSALKRTLPAHMLPAAWRLETEPLPRNENGKFDRTRLRAMAAEGGVLK